MHRFRRLSVALTVAGVLGVAAPAAASATSTSRSAVPPPPTRSCRCWRQKYVKLHPHKVKFKIAQGGTQVGINDVKAGHVTIADVSQRTDRRPTAGLVFYPIAKYAICVVTNKANTLSNLTPAQVTSIFTGKTRPGAACPAPPPPALST